MDLTINTKKDLGLHNIQKKRRAGKDRVVISLMLRDNEPRNKIHKLVGVDPQNEKWLSCILDVIFDELFNIYGFEVSSPNLIIFCQELFDKKEHEATNVIIKESFKLKCRLRWVNRDNDNRGYSLKIEERSRKLQLAIFH